jgi:hypothetical protein
VIVLADLETGQEVHRLENPEQARAGMIMFTPDGTKIICGSGDTQSVFVWDLLAIGKELKARGLPWDLPSDLPPISGHGPYMAIALAGDRVPAELSDEIVLEADNLAIKNTRRSGAVAQLMAPWASHHWSNDHQLLCVCESGGYIELGINWPDSGKYLMSIVFTQAPDYGIVETALDDMSFSQHADLYASEVQPGEPMEMGTVNLAPGQHTLRFTAIDTNPMSGRFLFGVDYVVFKPVK